MEKKAELKVLLIYGEIVMYDVMKYFVRKCKFV